MTSPRTPRPMLAVLAAVFLTAVVVRIIPALAVLWVSPDSVEYLDIARRLAHGEGFTLSIKAYYFAATPVIHYGGLDRPPLFPALVALLWRFTSSAYAPQMLNLILAAIGAALGAALTWRIYGKRAALMAGLLLAASPALVRTSLYPWSEPSAFVFLLVSILFITNQNKKRFLFVSGLCAGLAFLARPTTASLAFVAGLYLLLRGGKHWREGLSRLGLFASGVAPSLIALMILNHSYGAPPLATAQAFIYRSLDFHQGMYYAPPRIAASALALIQTQGAAIARQIYRHFRDYARALFFSREWLGLFTLLLPLLFVRLVLSRSRFAAAQTPTGNGKERLLIFVLAATGFLFIVLSWPSFDLDRFLQIPCALLLIGVIGESDRWIEQWPAIAARRAGRLVLWLFTAVALTIYLMPAIENSREALRRHSNPQWAMMGIFSRNWRNPDSPALFRWIASNTPPEAIIASTNPWAISWHTHRPAILLPDGLDAGSLRKFLAAYGVNCVILNATYPPPQTKHEPDYGAMLEGLENVRKETIQSYTVYQKRIRPESPER